MDTEKVLTAYDAEAGEGSLREALEFTDALIDELRIRRECLVADLAREGGE